MRKHVTRVLAVLTVLLILGDGLASANAGKSCTKIGQINKKAGTVCARVKGKLIWQKSSATSASKSGFGDGTYRVGTDMPAGLYSAAGSSLCYWARLSNFSGSLDSILANSIGGGREIVELKPSDVGFKSTRCGTWSRFSPSPTATMIEGTYKVGEEIQAGLWRTTTANTCYWSRLSGFSGDLDDVISNELPSGSTALVEILPTDVGFRSSRCGTWTRVG